MAVNDFLLELERLFLDFRNRAGERVIHIRVRVGRRHRVFAPVNDDFAYVPVFLDLDAYVSTRSRIVEEVRNFVEVVFDVRANRGRHLNMTPRVFKLHPEIPPKMLDGRCQMLVEDCSAPTNI